MCGNLHVAWQWKGRAKIFVGLTAWLHVVSKVVGQCKIKLWEKVVYLGCGPLTVTVTTRIITFLVGDPYKPSFTTVPVRGPPQVYPRNSDHAMSCWHGRLDTIPAVSIT